MWIQRMNFGTQCNALQRCLHPNLQKLHMLPYNTMPLPISFSALVLCFFTAKEESIYPNKKEFWAKL